MQIVSWNCHGKFKEKFRRIKQTCADIYVIQECENPQKYIGAFDGFYTNYIWYGEKDSKGLAIFAKPDVVLRKNDWPVYCLRHFLSVNVNDRFDLLGVWACFPYIEEYCIYQAINIDRYTEKTVIIGDFNSNAIWDKEHGRRNHSTVVGQLKEKGLVSAYHYITQEAHGSESTATYCMYKHTDKPYHIDYCFTAPQNISDFRVLDDSDWLKYSDHYPIIIEIPY